MANDLQVEMQKEIDELRKRILSLETLEIRPISVRRLKVGSPAEIPSDGSVHIENDLRVWGGSILDHLDVGSPSTPAPGVGDAAIAGDLNIEGSVTSPDLDTRLVTGGDSHDHFGGDGAVIPEGGLASAVANKLVTGGNSHDHSGGDGAPIAGIVTGGNSHDHSGGDGAPIAGIVTGGNSHDHAGGDGGTIGTDALAANAVTAAKIGTGEVGSDEIASGAVDTNELAAGAVTNLKLGAQSVDTAELANLAVGTAKITADAVDDTKVGDRVPQFYRRKGGSSSNWSTPGGSTYTPGAVRIQAGVVQVTISDGSSGTTDSINFPVNFGDAPIVLLSSKSANRAFLRTSSISSSGFSFGAWRNTTSGTWTVDVHWFAVASE